MSTTHHGGECQCPYGPEIEKGLRGPASLYVTTERHDMEMEDVQRGVSNFRTFQLKSERHTGQIRALAMVWSGIFAVILVLAGIAVDKIEPVFRVILDEYYRTHPQVTEQLKHDKASTEPVQARESTSRELSTIPTNP